MALGNPIQIRLSPEKQFILEREAEAAGKPLGTFLREKLEGETDTRDELAALRRAVDADLGAIRDAVTSIQDRSAPTHAGTGPSRADNGLLLEIALLLRAIAGPERMKLVQTELRRLGFDVWQANEGPR